MKKGAAFEEIDVYMDMEARTRMETLSGGAKTVPQIFIGETHVGGSDDLYALECCRQARRLAGTGNRMSAFRAACVQLRSSDDVADNIRIASALIRDAKAQGAEFIATPENTTLMAPDGGAKLERSFSEADDPALPPSERLRKSSGVWLLIGSLAIKVDETKTANRSFLVDPKGRVAARYDKIHLFDVDLPSGENYRESRTVAGGDEAVIADLPWGRLGLSICYDLRFPQLYRALARAGSFALSVPSAFTETTGKAHWHVLLRARCH